MPASPGYREDRVLRGSLCSTGSPGSASSVGGCTAVHIGSKFGFSCAVSSGLNSSPCTTGCDRQADQNRFPHSARKEGVSCRLQPSCRGVTSPGFLTVQNDYFRALQINLLLFFLS